MRGLIFLYITGSFSPTGVSCWCGSLLSPAGVRCWCRRCISSMLIPPCPRWYPNPIVYIHIIDIVSYTDTHTHTHTLNYSTSTTTSISITSSSITSILYYYYSNYYSFYPPYSYSYYPYLPIFPGSRPSSCSFPSCRCCCCLDKPKSILLSSLNSSSAYKITYPYIQIKTSFIYINIPFSLINLIYTI